MSLLEIRPLISKHVWDSSRKTISRVVDIRPGRFYLSGLVLSSDRNFYYSPYVTVAGDYYCDCQGFSSTEAICSHILAVMRKAYMLGIDITPWIKGLKNEYDESEYMKVYKTSLESYNKLFGGLQAGRYISAVCAPPEKGKSYLNATFAVDMCLNHNKNALIIDTEGGFTPEWIENIAKDRNAPNGVAVEFINWRVRVDENNNVIRPLYKAKDFDGAIRNFGKYLDNITVDKPTVFIYDARHIVQILPFFGRPLSFKVKGGVVEPQDTGDLVPIWESPIGLLVEKFNIGYVAIDSLSAPIESFFTGGQINYRTRAKTTQALLGRCQDLIDEYELVLMVSAHATINHANPYDDPKIVGGKAVLHNVKCVLYMDDYTSKAVAKSADVNWRNLRKFTILRHPMKTPFSETTYAQTTPYGVKDFDRSQYVK